MTRQETIRISHVLYLVEELHEAVKRLRQAGFTVNYGTDPAKAYNALIWFEQGAFIEIFQATKVSAFMKWLMKLCGYRSALDRMAKWQATGSGWCEWALESTAIELEWEKRFFDRGKRAFKGLRKRRKDIDGQVLSWQLLLPADIYFPFIMSAYVPDPRPETIEHLNGAKGIATIVIGQEEMDTAFLDQLLPAQTGIEWIAGKTGLQTVRLSGNERSIESILG